MMAELEVASKIGDSSGTSNKMALAQALSTIRSGVISNIRLPVGGLQAASGSLSGVFSRSFAEGTYLNKDDVTERVLSVVKNFDKADPAKVTPSSHFQKDLGMDSLDTVEVVMAFEEEFGVEIPDAEADKILSTSDAITYIAAHPQAH